MTIFNNFIIIVSLIMLIIINFTQSYFIFYYGYLIFFILLGLIIYFSGLTINEKTNYQKNINIYLFLYLILLFSLTIFIARPTGLLFLEKDYFIRYLNNSINLIPFKTIIEYLSDHNFIISFTNLAGNFVALMPLAFLLILKDNKYLKLKEIFMKLFLTVLAIESFQFLTCSGQVDIDDFILNISGGLFLYYIIIKLNLINFVKKLFNINFKINKILSISIYVILYAIATIILGIITYEMLVSSKYAREKQVSYFVEKIDNCQENTELTIQNRRVFLVCASLIFEDKKNNVMDFETALLEGIIDFDYFAGTIDQMESLENSHTLYRSIENNITIIYCNPENGTDDVYIGDRDMQMKVEYCR